MENKALIALLRMQLQAGQTVQVTVQGVSMEPLLHSGQVVSLRMPRQYQIGDIAAFLYGHEGLLLHRIIELREGFVHLRGDNAVRVEIVPLSSLLGVLTEEASS